MAAASTVPARVQSLLAQEDELSSQLEGLQQWLAETSSRSVGEATQHNVGLCGRQSLKRQLQSLKATFLSLGQKEAFTEAIKVYSASQNYKAEADRALESVETAEEDLKDLKKVNQQDEEQLQHLVQSISACYEQCQTVTLRAATKMTQLQQTAQNLKSVAQAQQQEGAVAGGEAVALLGGEDARALELEAQLAAASAQTTDLANALDAQLKEIAQLQAEQEQLQASHEQEAQQETNLLAWCKELGATLEHLTGVSLVEAGHDKLILRMVAGEVVQAGVETSSYMLSIRLKPGTECVHSAELDPPDLDLAAEVDAAAQNAFNSLPILISLVRAAIREMRIARQPAC